MSKDTDLWMSAFETPKTPAPIGGKKYDDGKPPVYRGVLRRFPRALLEVAKVSAVGAEKYGVPVEDTSCVTVDDGFLRYRDADVRHLLNEVIEGEWNTETGGELPPEGRRLLHAAQHAWDALCALEIMLIKKEKIEGATEYAKERMGGVPGICPPAPTTPPPESPVGSRIGWLGIS